MQNYVNQLLDDLNQLISDHNKNAEENSFLEINTESNDDLLELSKLYIMPEKTFSILLDIPQEALPPTEDLSAIQISQLLEKLTELLAINECFLDFPSKIRDEKKYSLLRSHWDEPQFICSGSLNTIDFCDYDQEHCIYGAEECECKSLEKLA
jgi:hypothetical protein